jgi:hypothetical protein
MASEARQGQERSQRSPHLMAAMNRSPGVRFVIGTQEAEELLRELGGVGDERGQFLLRLSRPAPSGGPSPEKQPVEAVCYLGELVAGVLEVIQSQQERLDALEEELEASAKKPPTKK